MDLFDTDLESRRIQARVLRRLTGAQKLAAVSGLTSLVHSIARAGVRMRMPESTETEVEAQYFTLVLGHELALKVLAYRRSIRAQGTDVEQQ